MHVPGGCEQHERACRPHATGLKLHLATNTLPGCAGQLLRFAQGAPCGAISSYQHIVPSCHAWLLSSSACQPTTVQPFVSPAPLRAGVRTPDKSHLHTATRQCLGSGCWEPNIQECAGSLFPNRERGGAWGELHEATNWLGQLG